MGAGEKEFLPTKKAFAASTHGYLIAGLQVDSFIVESDILPIFQISSPEPRLSSHRHYVYYHAAGKSWIKRYFYMLSYGRETSMALASRQSS